MGQRRGSTDGLLLSGSDRGHVVDRQQALEEGEEGEQQQLSPWQAPGDVIAPVLETLLSMEGGPHWVSAVGSREEREAPRRCSLVWLANSSPVARRLPHSGAQPDQMQIGGIRHGLASPERLLE